jgi:hypothetical protein
MAWLASRCLDGRARLDAHTYCCVPARLMHVSARPRLLLRLPAFVSIQCQRSRLPAPSSPPTNAQCRGVLGRHQHRRLRLRRRPERLGTGAAGDRRQSRGARQVVRKQGEGGGHGLATGAIANMYNAKIYF